MVCLRYCRFFINVKLLIIIVSYSLTEAAACMTNVCCHLKNLLIHD